MNIAVIDIETEPIPALVKDIKKIYCIAIKYNDEETKCYTYVYTPYSDGNLTRALKIINSADLVVGHNIIKFDIPVIENVLGKVTPKLCDTLIDTKLMYSSQELINIDSSISDLPKSLIGSYSLKAFGYRFNYNKIDYTDFTALCEDMVTYCKRDVDLTYKLYTNLINNKDYPNELVRQTEYHFARCIYHQEQYGFYFDIDKAMKYATDLAIQSNNIYRELKDTFKPIFVPDGDVVVSKSRRNKQWIETNPDDSWRIRPYTKLKVLKNGKIKFPPKSTKWFDKPHRLVYTYTDGAYQKIKLQHFNPGSRSQVVDRLMRDYDWKPTNYTENGNIRLEFK